MPNQCLDKGDFQNYKEEDVRSSGHSGLSEVGRASKNEKYWGRGKGKVNGKCRLLDDAALMAKREKN